MARAMISPKFYAWDRDGKPLAFGKVYTYQARTNSPKPTFQSEDQIVANTNPVILNGEGYANIYLDGAYKIVLKDKDENEIWTADPVTQSKGDGDTYSQFTLTGYYATPTTIEVLGDYTTAILEGMKITVTSLGTNGKDFDSTSTVVSSDFDGSRTSIVITDAIVTTSIKCVSVTNWPFEEIAAIEEFVESDDLTFETPQGETKLTISGIEAKAFEKVASVPLNGGVWDSGIEFNAYNQYMIYNGISYKPKPTTALPYLSTATPDTDFVEPFSDLRSSNLGQLTDYLSLSVDNMTAGLVIGGETITHLVGQIWSSGKGKWKVVDDTLPITIDSFEPIGDIYADDFSFDKTGATNGFDLFKNISEITNTYGERSILFTAGDYDFLSGPQTDINNWIRFRNGVKIKGEGKVNFIEPKILVDGDFGPLINISASGATTGDRSVEFASAHNLELGDHFQILSQRNCYTTDGLNYQLGSENPTFQTTTQARFAEIHQVSKVESATEVNLAQPILYPEYANNTSGLGFPIPGVTSAELRKINFVEGFEVDGIEFTRNQSSFRGLYLRACKDPIIKGTYNAQGNPGRHIRTEHCLGVKFIDAKSVREPEAASGSSWNSFIIGACSQDTTISGVRLTGDQQVIDVTNSLADGDAGFTDRLDLRCEGLSTQFIDVHHNKFFGCADGFTTHPGTYGLTFNSNEGLGNSTFGRIRSRKNLIFGNVSTSKIDGFVFSAFYDETLVYGNTLMPIGGEAQWTAISIVPMSSETMNNNDIQDFVIFGNTFSNLVNQPLARGVQLRHYGNGVPPAGFTGFTDDIKTGQSKYIIEGNTFNNATILCNKWNNGVSVINNKFLNGNSGTQDQYYINFFSNAAKATIDKNMFLDGALDGILTSNVTDPVSWPYDTTHRVGSQQSPRGAIVSSISNAAQLFVSNNDGETRNGSDIYTNGRGIKAVRGSGAATLRIDASPSDGISQAEIRLFDETVTTGAKILRTNARVLTEDCDPGLDATYDLGGSSLRWNEVYAVNGTINTSDETQKQFYDITEVEKSVALKIKSNLKKFKWNEAIKRNLDGGKAARLHFGVGAQTVKAIFESEGLNPDDYSLFCYDEWDDEYIEILGDDGEPTGESKLAVEKGSRYGIRYTELLAFILSAI